MPNLQPSDMPESIVGAQASPKLATLSVPTAKVSEPPSAAGAAGTALLALLLVIGLVLLLAKLAKKLPGIGIGGGRKDFRIVATLPLGTKDRLVVIEVGDAQLLLGVGEAGPRLLQTLAKPLSEADATPSAFAQVLASQFRKQR